MRAISEENLEITRALVQAFGRESTVRRHLDDAEENFVDILTCPNHPEKGVSSYSTIGLSDSPLIMQGLEYPTRLEIVGACYSEFTDFDLALGTAAFCIINSKWPCYPGAIFPDVLKMYNLSPTMKHFLFVPPFLWEDTLKTMYFEKKTVAWLLAVPISEKEIDFAEKNGPDALEDIFVEKQIDIYDLKRLSVL